MTAFRPAGIDFRPYVILGACNPQFAHRALELEDKIGTMLPCNVIVQQKHGGVEVSAIAPPLSGQTQVVATSAPAKS